MGRPKKEAEKSPSTGKELVAIEKLSKEDLAEIAAENKALASQSQFNARQLRFLECYLIDGEKSYDNLSKSIQEAGYSAKSASARCLLGRMILNKYESGTEHAEIMRKMGFGEIWIIQRLAHLAQNARAESVQFQALNTMAKCIGMQKDYGDTGGGTEINIYPTEKLPAVQTDAKISEIEIVASTE